jgi:organic hydroperoxide reductase OsmC/OhrA
MHSAAARHRDWRARPSYIRGFADAQRAHAAEREGMRAKEYRFPVRVEWMSGRTVAAGVLGKPALAVSPPREFHTDADPSVWSPEDLFCNAAATCLAVGIARLAESAELPVVSLDVCTEGVVGRREDGRFGFTRLEQVVELVTEPGCEDTARDVIHRAEESCLVAASLDVAVETRAVVYSSAVSPGRGSTTPDSGVPTTDGLAGRR